MAQQSSQRPQLQTVDGSFEIRRSTVEVGSWNPIIYKVLAPSQVVLWDFWSINSTYEIQHQFFGVQTGSSWENKQTVFGSIPRDAKNFPPSDVIPLVPLLSFSCCAKHSKNSSKDSGDAGTSWGQWNAGMSCPPSCSGLSKWNVIQALITITIDATLVLMLLIYNFCRCVDYMVIWLAPVFVRKWLNSLQCLLSLIDSATLSWL